jgi:hypothetical protein
MTRRPTRTPIAINAAAAALPSSSAGTNDVTGLAIVGGISVVALAVGLFVGKKLAKRS